MVLQFLSKLQKNGLQAIANQTFEVEMNNFRSDDEKASFFLKHVPLTSTEIDLLCKVIKTSSTMEHLSLIGCNLDHLDVLQPLMKAIKRSKTLKSLNLSHNALNSECIRLICEVVQLKSTVVELDLSNCDLKAEDMKYVKTMLEYNKSIKALALHNNSKLKDEGVKAIVTGFLSSPLGEVTAVEELDLSECGLSDSCMKEVASLVLNTNLKKLSVADNFISKIGSKTLATGLKTSQTLEYFNISGNIIGDDGLKSIMALFSAETELKYFLVNGCGLSLIGMTNLFEVIIKYDNLIGLGINNNNSDQESKQTLSELIINLISLTTRLEHIDCSNIDFTEDDFKNFGHFLSMTLKCTIKSLNLSNTNLTDQGLVELADGLYLNRELAELDITKNPFSIKGVRALAKTLKRNKSMKLLRISGQARIKAEGENHLAEILKYNKSLQIKGTTNELDYLNSFAHNGGCFLWNEDKTKILSWSEDAWQVVKRGTGQIIGVAIENLSKPIFKQFLEDEVIFNSRNVVSQDMFEYVIRHADKPCLEVVSVFVNKCGIPLDTPCESKTSKNISSDKRKSDDVTYREIAKNSAKDEIVKELAKNNKLFLSRYLTKNGPAIHETNELLRVEAVDTQKSDERVFIEIYENEKDFEREVIARDTMKEKLKGGGPFAIYDTILKEIEVHKDENCISFLLPHGGSMSGNLTDLRHCINNIGITAGYDISETIFLLKRIAQCLGTVNNLGRVHGDFRPRNFIKVAKKRLGKDPLGKTNKNIILPDKWVLMDFSKSLEHDSVYDSRLRSGSVGNEFGFDGSCGSGYLSPEIARIIFHKNSNYKVLPKINEKQDVWSFGVVLYQLLTGVHLFSLEQNTDKLYKNSDKLELMNWINLDSTRKDLILHRSAESLFLNPTTFKRIKEAAIDLCSWCLQGNPFNRPNFNEILSHPLFYYKTTVNYNNLDLLLGWYKKIGSSKVYSADLNDRSHYYILNSSLSHDILQNLTYYLKKKSSTIVESDLNNHKLDISKRKEKIMKSRTIIVLLEPNIFQRKDILLALMWAKQSKHFHNFIFLDCSKTAVTSVGSTGLGCGVDWNEVSVDQIDLSGFYPVSEKVGLKEIKDKELKSYLENIFEFDIKQNQRKVIPYRTNSFQVQAMIDEILKRSKLVSDTKLLQEEKREEEEEQVETVEEQKETVKVVILFNEEEDKIKENIQKLSTKLLKKSTAGQSKIDIDLISSSNKLLSLSYFTLLSGTSKGTSNQNLRQLEVQDNVKVIVLLLVSKGFYSEFNKDIVLLEQAKGNLSMIPISYNCYDVSTGEGKEEVLNLGIENQTITERLMKNTSYIPLPISNDKIDLKYETKASLEFIKKETEKVSGIMKLNEEKDENDIYTRYTRTNFFESVY